MGIVDSREPQSRLRVFCMSIVDSGISRVDFDIRVSTFNVLGRRFSSRNFLFLPPKSPKPINKRENEARRRLLTLEHLGHILCLERSFYEDFLEDDEEGMKYCCNYQPLSSQ